MNFVTIHNTGNADHGANARAHNAFIRGTFATNAPVSWHYTVDEREIYQHLPENEDAFHAGDSAGNGNRQSIGIEICMNSDGDLRLATDNAVELTADICRRRNILIGNIVEHNHWNGKNCPQMLRAGHPYSWNEFIERVREAMQAATPTPTPPSPPPSRPTIDQLARDVIAGQWGNGDERRHGLNAAGHDAVAVQRRVNEILGSDSSSASSLRPVASSVDDIARQVIRGDWGNGDERRHRLTAAGHNARAVQARVNEMLR